MRVRAVRQSKANDDNITGAVRAREGRPDVPPV